MTARRTVGRPGGGFVIQRGQALAPRLAVLGHICVVPAVGFAGHQPLVEHLDHRYPGFVVLAEQQVDQRPDGRLLHCGEKRQPRIDVQPGENNAGGDQVPAPHLGEDIEVPEATLAARRHRRVTSASPREGAVRSPIAFTP